MKRQVLPTKKSDTYYPTDITIAGKAHLKSTLYLQSRADLKGTMSVGGESTFHSNAVFKDKLTNYGDASFEGAINVEGIATFQKPIFAKSTIDAASINIKGVGLFCGGIKSEGGFDCEGAMHVKEKATFTQIEVREWIEVNGELVVNKSIRVDKDLLVGEKAIFKGFLSVEKVATFQKGMLCGGGAIITGHAQVGKDLDVGGEFTVHKKATLKDALIIKKDFAVVGESEFHGRALFNADIHAKVAKFTENIETEEVNCANLYSNVRAEFNDVDIFGEVRAQDDVFILEGLDVKGKSKLSGVDCEYIEVAAGGKFGSDVMVDGSLSADAVKSNHMECKTLKVENGFIKSGSYHPEITKTKNVDYFIANECQFMQIGAVVTVSGRIDIQAEKVDEESSLRMSLPVSSNLRAAGILAGCGSSHDAKTFLTCFGDGLTQTCHMVCVNKVLGKYAFFFTFTYSVIE